MKFLIGLFVTLISIGTLNAQTLVATYNGEVPGTLMFFEGQIAYEELVPVEGLSSTYSAVQIKSLTDVTLITWTPPEGRYFYIWAPRLAWPWFAESGYYFLTVPTTGFTSNYDLSLHLLDDNKVEYFVRDHANISNYLYNSVSQTYYIGLKIHDTNGDVILTEIYQGASFTTSVSNPLHSMMRSFELKGNYPNPFNSSTTISFNLPQSGHTSLHIFNILGQRIKTLIDGELYGGEHEILWDGRNESGHTVSSGQYFYQVTMNGEVISKSMILLK